MDLIDSGKAFLNPVAVYLEYGKYNKNDDTGGRNVVRNLSEVQLDLNKSVIYCWNKTEDIIAKRFDEAIYENITKKAIESFVKIEGNDFSICKIECPQGLYEKIMGENPRRDEKGINLPVEVCWYDAIYFCNEYSRISGLTPVYSVNGEKDVTKWNYKPHSDEKINGRISFDLNANGYRLPTASEWDIAVVNNSRDLEKYYERGRPHMVIQGEKNEFGLYNMRDNVSEWCSDFDEIYKYEAQYKGMSYKSSDYGGSAIATYGAIGFRLVRTVK